MWCWKLGLRKRRTQTAVVCSRVPGLLAQSLLVLLAAKACRFPIWLRPLWICATWISTLFWKQLGRENKINCHKIRKTKTLHSLLLMCVPWHNCGSQRVILWSLFFLSAFIWVLRTELRSPGFDGKCQPDSPTTYSFITVCTCAHACYATHVEVRDNC